MQSEQQKVNAKPEEDVTIKTKSLKPNFEGLANCRRGPLSSANHHAAGIVHPQRCVGGEGEVEGTVNALVQQMTTVVDSYRLLATDVAIREVLEKKARQIEQLEKQRKDLGHLKDEMAKISSAIRNIEVAAKDLDPRREGKPSSRV
ncbi:hypothetical protein QR680_017336 [Steinernema hermaphroditum]|uniref:Uncharacterized protein n=1 Tax=Steinernema hermaphroditum TaxID=289476 RepID=A0AA39HE66_9BILA|nr:hypothetical protein QR680_017336 [Steinernema hermaphroditum]